MILCGCFPYFNWTGHTIKHNFQRVLSRDIPVQPDPHEVNLWHVEHTVSDTQDLLQHQVSNYALAANEDKHHLIMSKFCIRLLESPQSEYRGGGSSVLSVHYQASDKTDTDSEQGRCKGKVQVARLLWWCVARVVMATVDRGAELNQPPLVDSTRMEE